MSVSQCTRCSDGYYLDSKSSTCKSCTGIDPNCLKCTPSVCTQCSHFSTLRSNGRCKVVTLGKSQCLKGQTYDVNSSSCVDCSTLGANCKACFIQSNPPYSQCLSCWGIVPNATTDANCNFIGCDVSGCDTSAVSNCGFNANYQ